jgi:hypothetical protein
MPNASTKLGLLLDNLGTAIELFFSELTTTNPRSPQIVFTAHQGFEY